MTGMELVFLILLILNTLTAAGYFIVCRMLCRKEAKGCREYLIKAAVMLLCPLIGPLFFVMVWLASKLLFRQYADLEDVIFSKERVRTRLRADEEQEGNVVPIEEALVICDKDSLRTLVMNVVRGNVEHSLASIALALGSEDTETAHYAATVLRDALNDFRQHAQEVHMAMELHNSESAEKARELIEYMNDVLRQKVFQVNEQISFIRMMEDACEYLYDSDWDKLEPVHFQWLCDLLLDVKEYERMKLWCARLREIYPQELTSYVCYLKYYFSVGQKREFFRELEQLKKSDIVIDKETLALIRIFN